MSERLIIRKRKLSAAQKAHIAKVKRTFVITPAAERNEAEQYAIDTMCGIRDSLIKRNARRK